MKLNTLLFIVALFVGGWYWGSAVRANDTKLVETAACADNLEPDRGPLWRAAWDACWEQR